MQGIWKTGRRWLSETGDSWELSALPAQAPSWHPLGAGFPRAPFFQRNLWTTRPTRDRLQRFQELAGPNIHSRGRLSEVAHPIGRQRDRRQIYFSNGRRCSSVAACLGDLIQR